MADGDVKYRFFADAAAAERAIAGLEKKYENLESKIKSVSRESKRSSKEDEDSLGRVSGVLGDLVGQYGTVAGAVGLVTAAYAAWRNEIDAAADAQDKFGRKLIADLALSGDLAKGQQVQRFLQSQQGITQEVGSAAFFGVRGGAPSMDLERAEDVAGQIAGTQGFIFRDNLEQLTAAGELAGKLAEIAPDKSAQDIADLTAAVQAAAGRNVGALTSQGTIKGIGKLVEGGKPLEEALALAVRGLDVGMRAQGLENIKAEDMQLLDPARVAALQQQFGQAQIADLSLRNFEAAAALAPDDLVEFNAAARLQAKLRPGAERRDAVGAEFASAEADAGFAERLGLRTIGRAAESVQAFGRAIFGMEDESTPDPSVEKVNAESQQILRDMLAELKKQNENRRPPIRREAQVE